MKHVSVGRKQLSKQLLALVDLNEAFSLHLGKLWWHVNYAYEKCLIDASAHTFSLHAEELKREALLLLGASYFEVDKTTQLSFYPPQESQEQLLDELYRHMALLQTSYSQLKKQNYAPLTQELIKQCASEGKDIHYSLTLLLKHLRFLESDETKFLFIPSTNHAPSAYPSGTS